MKALDRHLDLDSVRTQLRPFYNITGRLSVDSEMMMRMLTIGYCMASGQSDGSVKRFTSISPIAGYAASDWTGRLRSPANIKL
jgi:hypothetical protein